MSHIQILGRVCLDSIFTDKNIRPHVRAEDSNTLAGGIMSTWNCLHIHSYEVLCRYVTKIKIPSSILTGK